jgi:hypothetical protein
MKVLLINPNRYKSPPVPPLGLEYIAASLEEKGHDAELLDLCFSGNIHEEIDRSIRSFGPDIAGITVRNVDSVLFHTNEFFLDGIRDIINHIKSAYGLKTVIGGAGVSVNPQGMIEYLNADFAVAGPAENTVHEILERLNGPDDKRIYYSRYPGRSSYCGRKLLADYGEYLKKGGLAGFETHKGCSSSCVYCIEANSKVSFKEPSDVIGEIKRLIERGCSHFHLCDSEFNESLEYSLDFCAALKNERLDIRWAVYMKPVNFSKKLFRLLKDTGVYLITLTVDSYKKCDLYWTDIEKFIFGAKSCGMKVAVDFLTGFPYETGDDIRGHLDNLRRPMPDSIGVNTYIRLYETLQLTSIIFSDAALREKLTGNTGDRTLIKPVFYNHIDTEMLRQIIDGDSIVRIEGPEQRVNYSRVDDPVTAC